ncbi:hypothetical protein FHX81_6969 [Saccharothrix saharensis]|uniref:Uncharacterized protein n=1 Tax=Saccharothrix saharensis TaxID=571190 RepID=A0A543JNU0_9PSEU|nr:hypothetical protein [Saccharothrix saharensis]TQM84521.1 hypothetical protein FHX81_6969 [Saccharothrix saharensis]
MQGRPVGDVSVKIGGNAHGPVAAGVGHVIRVNDAERDAAVGTESGRRPDLLAAHRVVVTTDVQRSSSRNNVGQRRMRRALEECVHAGAAALGVVEDSFEVVDRGDGVQVVMPEAVTPVDVLDTFVEAVAKALREHNAAASDGYRIDLRAAVHVGYVDRVSGEWSGTPLVHAARLADAPEVKRALEEDGDACLALVVSDAVKRVVDEGYCRIGPAGYRHVAVLVKGDLG